MFHSKTIGVFGDSTEREECTGGDDRIRDRLAGGPVGLWGRTTSHSVAPSFLSQDGIQPTNLLFWGCGPANTPKGIIRLDAHRFPGQENIY